MKKEVGVEKLINARSLVAVHTQVTSKNEKNKKQNHKEKCFL